MGSKRTRNKPLAPSVEAQTTEAPEGQTLARPAPLTEIAARAPGFWAGFSEGWRGLKHYFFHPFSWVGMSALLAVPLACLFIPHVGVIIGTALWCLLLSLRISHAPGAARSYEMARGRARVALRAGALGALWGAALWLPFRLLTEAGKWAWELAHAGYGLLSNIEIGLSMLSAVALFCAHLTVCARCASPAPGPWLAPFKPLPAAREALRSARAYLGLSLYMLAQICVGLVLAGMAVGMGSRVSAMAAGVGLCVFASAPVMMRSLIRLREALTRGDA